MSRPRRPPTRRPRDAATPVRTAAYIAKAVDLARAAAGLGGDIEIALTVVGGLALAYADGPRPAGQLSRAAAQDPRLFAHLLYTAWARFWITRPDLVPPTAPLWAWLRGRPTHHQLRGAQQLALAARVAGVDRLLGDDDSRRGTDLLGLLLSTMRSRVTRADRGQFYTPQVATRHMATSLDVHPGQTVVEPAAGTGALLCAAAAAMRERGHDAAQAWWFAGDIDPLAVGCLAVNTAVWELGPRVVIGCGDSLDCRDDWVGRALRQRRAAIARGDAARLAGMAVRG